MRDLTRGHAALRIGRTSVPGREYFLTVCTDQRRMGLTLPLVASRILREIHAMHDDATWQLRCAVVMPDHIHLLVILGERLSLGKAVARLKAKTAGAIQKSIPELIWERGFFDHAVRPDEPRLPLFLYIYLNPYRANVCAESEKWPWFYCADEDWFWFKGYLDADLPPPEWLM